MGERWKRYWPVLKVVFTAVILIAVGRQFARDLGKLEQLGVEDRPFRVGWLIAAGLFYLVGIGTCALFWDRLLRRFDQRPSVLGMLRAYYVGHLGKYSPGKAWALLLRTGLARADGIRVGVAALTSTYEVLVTMASGVLLAAVLFLFLAPETASAIDWTALQQLFLLQAPDEPVLDRKVLVLLALVMLIPLGVVTTPAVFNRLTHRLTKPFRKRDPWPLPRLTLALMIEGLVVTAVGWVLLGASLLAVCHAIMPEPPPWTGPTLALYTAYLGTAYVAGFMILIVPGGLGVREFFLTVFLVPDLARLPGGEGNRAYAVLAVVLLRLVWTAAEVLAAGILYLLSRLATRRPLAGPPPDPGEEGEDQP